MCEDSVWCICIVPTSGGKIHEELTQLTFVRKFGFVER